MTVDATEKPENMDMVRKRPRIPPDGGYGWVISFTMGFTSFFYMPMTACFGLIFKDTFAQQGLSATRVSLILNLYASFGMLTGVLNGVLLKLYGYRKVAFLAAVLYFSGLTLASQTRNYLVWYGLVASLGMGLCRSAYTLAVNTYFQKRRSQAMSYAITTMALGSTIMPQVINLLMKFYSPNGVLLILAGLSGHFFVTAMLLQPVKWHMKVGENTERARPRPPPPKGVLQTLVAIFDLDLLKDPVFLNILLGTSLVFFSEINFNLLTPFILYEYKLTTGQISGFMSTAGCADIICRLLAPYISKLLNQPPRVIYVLTLLVQIATICVILAFTDFYVLLLCAVAIGISRGIRRVNTPLIIPAHVSLEKLPSAAGMGMMTNGLCTLTGGSILGVVRDWTGSYSACLIIMSCVSFTAITLWTIEAIIVKYKSKQSEERTKDEIHPLNE